MYAYSTKYVPKVLSVLLSSCNSIFQNCFCDFTKFYLYEDIFLATEQCKIFVGVVGEPSMNTQRFVGWVFTYKGNSQSLLLNIPVPSCDPYLVSSQIYRTRSFCMVFQYTSQRHFRYLILIHTYCPCKMIGLNWSFFCIQYACGYSYEYCTAIIIYSIIRYLLLGTVQYHSTYAPSQIMFMIDKDKTEYFVVQ